jgi:hypothetical protein
MKKIFIVTGILLLAAGIVYFYRPIKTMLPTTEQATVPTTPACQAVRLIKPTPNSTITQQYIDVEVFVDNSNPPCRWTVFEALAGRIEIKDTTGAIVGKGALTTTENWMTKEPVTYRAQIVLDPETKKGQLTLNVIEDNPSGAPGQKVSFPIQYH